MFSYMRLQVFLLRHLGVFYLAFLFENVYISLLPFL
jgi:hypothetical protein